MSYIHSVNKDNPVGFWPLSNNLQDMSGCNNNASINGTHVIHGVGMLGGSTVITGTSYISIPLDKDYYTDSSIPPIANSNSSTNEFSIELWVKPNIENTNEVPLFADILNDTGIFYQNGNIIFKAEGNYVEYTINNISEMSHICAIYSINNISIYVNGSFAQSIQLNGFRFNAEDVNFQIGPVIDPSDYLLISGVAVYRYALTSNQIYDHYYQVYGASPIQIAYPDNGYLFEINNKLINRMFTFEYPTDKAWSEIAESPVEHNLGKGYLELSKNGEDVSKQILDVLSVPSMEDYDSSVINWDGSEGIIIEISQDNSTFYECKNGMPLPIQDQTKSVIYLRITFSSVDAQRFNPRLNKLRISFYKQPKLYSVNSGDYISFSTGGGTEIGFTWNNMPILTQSKYNGLRAIDTFSVYTDKDIYSVETFYTPETLDAGSIFDQLSWDSSGILDKTNITAIYVNGEDKTSETNVSGLFTPGYIHHVIIVLNSSVSEEIIFNQGGNEALYQYITIYESQMNAGTAQAHYDIWMNNVSTIADGGALALTENSINYYNNDWIVIQNI